MIRTAAILIVMATMAAFAQTAETPSQPAAHENVQGPEAYRLAYSINELEGSKIINSRQYSMNLNVGDRNWLKIGARVPVEAKQGEFQYLDIGTSLFGHLAARGNSLALEVKAEVSSLATPDESGRGQPVVRQLKIDGSTVALPGKPMLMGTAEDPASKRQFQLEVTVTKLR